MLGALTKETEFVFAGPKKVYRIFENLFGHRAFDILRDKKIAMLLEGRR